MKKKYIILMILIFIIITFTIILIVINKKSLKENDDMIIKEFEKEVNIDNFIFSGGVLVRGEGYSIYSFVIKNANSEDKSIKKITVNFYDKNNKKIGSMWYASDDLRNFPSELTLPIDLYKEINLTEAEGIKYEISY